MWESEAERPGFHSLLQGLPPSLPTRLPSRKLKNIAGLLFKTNKQKQCNRKYFNYIYLCVCAHKYLEACMWRVEVNLWELVESQGRQVLWHVPLPTETPRQLNFLSFSFQFCMCLHMCT